MISVVMPTYNRAKTINRAIDSVLNQTYKDIEFIIVDDASTDNTEAIVKGYNDKRIKYIKLEENKGANYARNIGIENARYDYIAFHDSDDEWYLNKLEKQLKFLKDTNSDITFTSYTITGYDTGDVIIPNGKIKNFNKDIYIKSLVGTPTILGKKKCFLNIKFDSNLPRFQEWDLMMRMATKYEIKHLNEVLLHAYYCSDSITKNNNNAIKALEIIRNKDYGIPTKLKNEANSYHSKNLGMFSYQNGDAREKYGKYYIEAFLYKRSLNNFILFLIIKLHMDFVFKYYFKQGEI